MADEFGDETQKNLRMKDSGASALNFALLELMKLRLRAVGFRPHLSLF